MPPIANAHVVYQPLKKPSIISCSLSGQRKSGIAAGNLRMCHRGSADGVNPIAVAGLLHIRDQIY